MKRPSLSTKLRVVLLLFILLSSGSLYLFWERIFPPPRRPVILTLQTWPLSAEEISFLRKVRPYGVILFEYSFRAGLDPVLLKNALVRDLKRNDLYFFVDQEGGSVNRLKGLYPDKVYPAANSFEQLVASGGEEKARQAAYQAGYEAGKDAKSQGFDVNLAPAAELCKTNGFLGSRCFSADPQTVSLLADAFAEGIHAAGTEPAFKHAPGIAYAVADPHNQLVHVNRSLEELKNNELLAMRHAGKWNYLLAGHAIYPAIDPGVISTFSPSFYRFLRRELGFKGLIITDALNMKSAAPGQYGRGEQMHMALEAGADIVTPFFSPKDSFEEQWKAIQHITPEQIRRFNQRLKELKK